MSSGADYLRASGLFGLAAGFALGAYQMFINDPMIPTFHSEIAAWMVPVHIHLLGLSLAVLLFSHYIDDVFRGYRRETAILAIIGQWGLPLTLYPLVAHEFGPIGPVHNLTGLFVLGVTVAFAVNYLRRGMGTAGD